jgi:hypothetical protein
MSPRIASVILVLFLIVPGAAGCVVFGLSALRDWPALQSSYAAFERISEQARAATGSSAPAALFIAEAKQNIHRINLLADGVWTLLSALLAGLGIHGLVTCGGRRRPAHEQ